MASGLASGIILTGYVRAAGLCCARWGRYGAVLNLHTCLYRKVFASCRQLELREVAVKAIPIPQKSLSIL